MEASTTSQVYIDVVEDVMVKIRDEFINNGGPGEEVLRELQAQPPSPWMNQRPSLDVNVGDTYQEQVEMHIKGWRNAYK